MLILINMKIPSQLLTKLLTVGLTAATFASSAQTPMDIRIALVIGNAAYKHIPELANSVNDARSMSTVLKKLGFSVVDVIDGSQQQINAAIEKMKGQLKGQHAVAMLYYAGHGLQLNWHNYMVPVDVRLNQASDVPKQTVDIEHVIHVFKESATRMNIVVLDACRDNPFVDTTGSKGLAQLDAPPGTYLAFATAPGNVAEDGDEATGNGLFTHYLLKELQRPASIEDVFKRVRLQVRRKSQGRQIPWDSSSLEDDFAFNDGKKFTFNPEDLKREAQEAQERQERLRLDAEAALVREKQLMQQREMERQRLAEIEKNQEQEARKKAREEALDRERQLAAAIELARQKAALAAQALSQAKVDEVQRLKDLELARQQQIEGERRKSMSAQAALDKQFADEKLEWDKIKDSKKAEDFYGFLLKYPTGLIAQQATFALEQLDKAKITAQADRNGLSQKAGESRFKLGDKFTRVSRDGYTGNVIRQVTSQVDRIEDGKVYVQSELGESIGTTDGAWFKTFNPYGAQTFDPPFLTMPGDELAVGKKWKAVNEVSNRFGKIKYSYEIRIVAYEKITIQAGTFWAYKFELNGWAGSTRVEETYWHLPDFGARIKSISKYVPPAGGATFEHAELVTLSRHGS